VVGGGGEFDLLVVLVVVVVMDVCVTEFWMQYKFLFTYPSEKLFLFGTDASWRTGQQ